MGKDSAEPRIDFTRLCPKSLLSSYPVMYPSYTSFSFKNFKSAVNFNLDMEDPSKLSLCRDVKSSHIRNQQLLDLPLKVPKCCYDIYNANVARQKQKKLQKFGLSLPVLVPDCSGKVEEKVEKVCDEERKKISLEKITFFPECYLLQDSGSEDDPEDEYKTCSSGSESECSACSTLGGGTRRRMHKVVKKDWRELLHQPPDPCKGVAEEELRKHKSKQFFEMKVKKLFKK